MHTFSTNICVLSNYQFLTVAFKDTFRSSFDRAHCHSAGYAARHRRRFKLNRIPTIATLHRPTL